MNKKKSQIWVTDFIIGLFIFIAGLGMFLVYSTVNDSDNSVLSIYSEAKTISDYLINEGYPSDWNSSNFIRVGLTTGDHTLDLRKLEEVTNMSKTNYDNLKSRLLARGDFLIYFEDKEGNILNLSEKYIARNTALNHTNIEQVANPKPRDIVKVFRYLVYSKGTPGSSEIIRMVIIYWV